MTHVPCTSAGAVRRSGHRSRKVGRFRLRRLAFAAGVLCAMALAGCGRGEAERRAAELTGGDPARGRHALRQYGCQSCHTIPGVPGANGLVGPPLTRMGSRVYIAGHLPNTPQNLVYWIRHPQDIDPRTAMPNTGVTEEDGRHIAAYLYTLR